MEYEQCQVFPVYHFRIQSCVSTISVYLSVNSPCLRLQVAENPNLVEFMTTIEELQGVVAGLVSVVKDLTTNVSEVTQTVGQMADAAPTASHHDKNQGLRMPSMQLPSFRRDSVIQDNISEFLE